METGTAIIVCFLIGLISILMGVAFRQSGVPLADNVLIWTLLSVGGSALLFFLFRWSHSVAEENKKRSYIYTCTHCGATFRKPTTHCPGCGTRFAGYKSRN